MTTITREWLQQTIAEFENTRDDIPFGLDDDDAKILKVLKQVLASFEAEPVGEFYHEKQGGWYQILEGDKVPDNRRIPLYTAPPVPERERIRREHAEWSDATFGDVGPVGPLKHLSKEALEAAADPSDPLEWADMQFLLWDAQRRMGISDEFITRAMIEKLEINKSRQWPEPKDGEPRLHIKEQPVPAASSESVSQSLTDALRDVIAERQRQVSVKGWTPEHDDTYTCGELSGVAISYIEPMEAVFYWPAEWHDDRFKPSDERRNLVKATALLLAEIERLDRISAASALSEVDHDDDK